jgi:hypothetical protein
VNRVIADRDAIGGIPDIQSVAGLDGIHSAGRRPLGRPSIVRSHPATAIGLSLGTSARNRAMVKVGLIASRFLSDPERRLAA